MLGPYLRKYGVETTINFPLPEPSGVDLVTGATFASGDLKISKDEGAEANNANLPTDEGTGYSLVLSATELQAARVIVYVIDQTDPKVWMDQAIVIETYGHASAQHAFDLGTDGATQILDADAESHDSAGSVGEAILDAQAMAANKKVIKHGDNEVEVYMQDGSTLRTTLTRSSDNENNETTVTPS